MKKSTIIIFFNSILKNHIILLISRSSYNISSWCSW